MEHRFTLASLAVIFFAGFLSSAAPAEHHHATHLGNLSTRFAPTMYSPEDLRARFRDPKLHGDFIEVLRQWGWQGELNDFFNAGLTNPITEWEIPVGETMPFMSSREAGNPVCLRNVTWEGVEPIHAYAFSFHSKGRIYRCVTPKPCSNFFLEDLGAEPRAGLAIDCEVPKKAVLGRTFQLCINVHNTGDLPEREALVALRIPEGALLTDPSDGVVTNSSLIWKISNLQTNASRQVCAAFKTEKPGHLIFNCDAGLNSENGALVLRTDCSCETQVIGIPAILLEKADDPDPVTIGNTTTYTVKVTNQGTADDSNVRVVVIVAPELVPVSSAEGAIAGQTVTLPLIPKLSPKQAVSYQIIAKGVSAGDGHTKFVLSSDVLTSPISAEESTTVY